MLRTSVAASQFVALALGDRADAVKRRSYAYVDVACVSILVSYCFVGVAEDAVGLSLVCVSFRFV